MGPTISPVDASRRRSRAGTLAYYRGRRGVRDHLGAGPPPYAAPEAGAGPADLGSGATAGRRSETGRGRGVERTETESIGGFFATRTGEPGPGHLPLSRLHAGDIAPLTARVDRVAARLRTPERRVAASIAHLGLAARLWSTALGPAALHGEFPDPAAGALYWDPELSSPDDLCWTRAGSLPGTVDSIREAVQFGHLVPLAEALRGDVRISRRLLWGNAGSALAGALREIHRWARERDRPEVADRATALTTGLLDHPDLSGTVRGAALRRTSCCLYYRCPGGGLCGDCAFDRPPRRPLSQPPAPTAASPARDIRGPAGRP